MNHTQIALLREGETGKGLDGMRKKEDFSIHSSFTIVRRG